jgi:hypothetical protein
MTHVYERHGGQYEQKSGSPLDESAGLPKEEKGDAASNETRFISLPRFQNAGKASCTLLPFSFQIQSVLL